MVCEQMKKRASIVVTILLLAVGFASISTTLIINGNTKVLENIDEYDVYYSNAKVNGVEDKNLIVDDKHIEFTTEMKSIGENYILEYYITNGSKNYDSRVNINCTSGNSYVNVNNTWVNDTLIESTETKIGTLTLEMIKGYTGNEELNLTVKCEIVTNAEERDTLGTGTPANKVISLYNLMKRSAKNDLIDFSVNSGKSGTNGIYKTTETEGNVPVYYYRGDADKVNNNIIFNNMCWKIIRTTETGGIKLIYNGTPTDGKCEADEDDRSIGESAFNASYDDNAYVGYMYGAPGSTTYELTHTNTNDSTIKTYIDNWYKGNFDETATKKLEDTVFCNDRSVTTSENNTVLPSGYGILGYGKNATIYGASSRASLFTPNPSPSLVCPQNNDKFTVDVKNGNGALTYPIGLITLDETIFAGLNTKASNSNTASGEAVSQTNYLTQFIKTYGLDTTRWYQWYWTMTPVYYSSLDISSKITFDDGTYTYVKAESTIGTISPVGSIDDTSSIVSNLNVRPVVSLASGTLVSSNGDGTSTNPYVVE